MAEPRKFVPKKQRSRTAGGRPTAPDGLSAIDTLEDVASKRKLGVPEFTRVPSHRWNQAWADRALISGFISFLFLPLLAWCFGWQTNRSLGENRRLAAPPSLAEEPFAKWPQAIDSYYRDNFGFRSTLVHADNVVLRMWLGVPSDRLVIGKDRWVFYYDATEKILENHLGLDPLTDEQLAAWKSYLEHKHARRAASGMKSLFVIAPDKQTIYPEMMPPYLSPNGRTRADQLIAYLHDTHSPANIIDLRPVLTAAKREGLIYFPQDSHWNGRGYFAAYREISRQLRSWFPDLPVQVLGVNFDVKRVAWEGGDWGHVGLPEENLKFPGDLLVPIDHQRVSLLQPELPSDVISPLAPWLAAIRTLNPQGRHRLLLLHDSFMSFGVGNRAEGPLTRDFETTLSIGRYLQDTQVIELENSFRPDVVIEEWVERQVRATP
jgi:alginate O-acetyltransferase complex protein AlgJ